MFLRSFLKHGVVCGLLIATVGGTALAKKGDGGGRGGDGGGGGGSGGRSSHSSGSSSGSRSFNGGGGGSFHSGGKSFSSKSIGGGSNSGSGGSNSGSSMSRSFQGNPFNSGNSGGISSSKSLNGSSSLRRSNGGGGSPSGGQVLQQSFNSSNDGKKWSGGSNSSNNSNSGRADFRPQTRGEFQGNLGKNGGNNSIGINSNQGSKEFVPRKLSDNNGSGGSSQANGSVGSGSGNNSQKWSNNGGKGGSQSDFSRRSFTTGKPTDEQVQNFLKLPKENREALRDKNTLPDGISNGAGRVGNDNNGPGSGNKTFRFNNDQLGNNGKNDPKWSGKLGDNNRDNNGIGSGSGNKEGKISSQLGDNKNGNGKWRGGRDGDSKGNRDGIPGVGGPNSGGTSIVDKHKNWDGKKANWQVGDRKQGDHRDLSGKWNDGHRFDVANDIRRNWKDDHDGHDDHGKHHDKPFHGDWWDNHRHHHHHGHGNYWGWGVYSNWNHYRPYYWWNWCSAPLLNSYFSFGWNTPYYWDYGPGEYIYCADNVIYVNGRWFAPAPVYYQQTQVLAQRVPDWTPEQAAQVEWLPLGVFVVTRDGVADNNLVVQLAVTDEGVIGGTAFNKAAGTTYEIQGTVDKQSQRAVWTYVDEKDARITMETGIYNLTQPESTALAHYGPQNIQVIQLVRLEQPAGEEMPQPAPAATGQGTVIIPPQAN